MDQLRGVVYRQATRWIATLPSRGFKKTTKNIAANDTLNKTTETRTVTHARAFQYPPQ
jgi:DNA-binding winged helix-turn-helix (wHTH) protein